MHKKSNEAAVTFNSVDGGTSDDDMSGDENGHDVKSELTAGDQRAHSIAALRAKAQQHVDRMQLEFTKLAESGLTTAKDEALLAAAQQHLNSLQPLPPQQLQSNGDPFEFSHTGISL